MFRSGSFCFRYPGSLLKLDCVCVAVATSLIVGDTNLPIKYVMVVYALRFICLCNILRAI